MHLALSFSSLIQNVSIEDTFQSCCLCFALCFSLSAYLHIKSPILFYFFFFFACLFQRMSWRPSQCPLQLCSSSQGSSGLCLSVCPEEEPAPPSRSGAPAGDRGLRTTTASAELDFTATAAASGGVTSAWPASPSSDKLPWSKQIPSPENQASGLPLSTPFCRVPHFQWKRTVSWWRCPPAPRCPPSALRTVWAALISTGPATAFAWAFPHRRRLPMSRL